MAFAIARTPFVHLGPEDDTRGIADLLPGEDVVVGSIEAVLVNAQRAWTCGHRAAYYIPSYASSSMTFVRATDIPLVRTEGRNGWKLYLDKEDCEVRASLRKVSDGSLVGIAITTVDGLGRVAPSIVSLTTTEATSVDLYLQVEVMTAALAMDGGVLHGGCVIEDEASV